MSVGAGLAFGGSPAERPWRMTWRFRAGPRPVHTARTVPDCDRHLDRTHYYRRGRQAGLVLSPRIEFETIMTTPAGQSAEGTPSPFSAADPSF